jgi:hypothetical protein
MGTEPKKQGLSDDGHGLCILLTLHHQISLPTSHAFVAWKTFLPDNFGWQA